MELLIDMLEMNNENNKQFDNKADTRVITVDKIENFRNKLLIEEKEPQTIAKYVRDIKKLMKYADGRVIDKELLLGYKTYLKKCGRYKISSINSYLAAANNFCEISGWTDVRVKMIKVQRETFVPETKEITMHEYEKLVKAAYKKGDRRLALIIETLGSTGIRISELQYVTAESLKYGMADIHNKGKARRILYPSELLGLLREYAKDKHILHGSIFVTAKGNSVNRSNVWRMMKKLCREAGVKEEKVYPHNMRHLFARSFYKIKNDIAKLADVLGHSSIDTTRIYIKSTGREHKRQLDKMNMVIGQNTIEKKKARLKNKGKIKAKVKKIQIMKRDITT